MEAPLQFFVSVPICGFRVAQAREYWETYPAPPPSTVYGMLLSLVGETNRLKCQGAEIAVAMLGRRPEVSVVLRRLWRVKNKNLLPGTGENTSPDYQELLTGVSLSVWVKVSDDSSSLYQRLRAAIDKPETITRFGGLCLGESTHLVDEIRKWRKTDANAGWRLVPDPAGDLSLPVWPNHVGSKGTRWEQFSLQKMPVDEFNRLSEDQEARYWITIAPR